MIAIITTKHPTLLFENMKKPLKTCSNV